MGGLDVPGLPVFRAAIVQTTNEFGLGLGVALLGTLGTAVYRGNVEGALGTCGTRRAAKAR